MSVSGMFIAVNKAASTPIAGVYSAKLSAKVDLLPKDSAVSGGFGDRDAGLADCTLNFSGWINVGDSAFPGVSPGDLIANLCIPVNANGSLKLLNMPSAIVESFDAGGETRGRLEFSAVVHNKGMYTLGTV